MQRKGSWLDFVKSHKNMRTAKGLLDLKAISKLWRQQKALDPSPKKFVVKWGTGERKTFNSLTEAAKYTKHLIKLGNTDAYFTHDDTKALDPKIIGYGKDKQWNKQLRATAQAKRSTQGQTKLTGGASTSRRLSEFFDPAPKTNILFNRVKDIFAKGDEFKSQKELYQIKQKIGKTDYQIAMREGLDIKYPSTKKQKVIGEKIVYYDPAPRKSKGQAGIKAWLKKQGIEPDTVDVEGQYDSNLSYSENIKNFKNMLKIDAAGHKAPQIPACANVSQLKAEIKDATEKAGIPDLKAELKDEKTKCDCTQMGLYDPAPRKSSAPPTSWFKAMYTGIKNRSDVRNPAIIVNNIWKKLTPQKQSIISAQAKKGKRFSYDLPLPDDRATRGTGTLRMVKPFKLAEVQVNLSAKDYLAALKSGLFSKMKRNDGTTALVARCKSATKNCNLFVDKVT